MNISAIPRQKKICILVIDDEEEIRNILERLLFGEGYDVEVAANGKHALQKIEAGKTYQLIICDLKMPLLNGSDFIGALRTIGKNIPVIVMTGQPERNWLMAATKSGISAVFLKPFRHHDLMTKIKELFPIKLVSGIEPGKPRTA